VEKTRRAVGQGDLAAESSALMLRGIRPRVSVRSSAAIAPNAINQTLHAKSNRRAEPHYHFVSYRIGLVRVDTPEAWRGEGADIEPLESGL